MHVSVVLCLVVGAPTLPDKPKQAVEDAWAVVPGGRKDDPPRVKLDDSGTVTLRDRGALVTRTPHGPVTVSFRLKWPEPEGGAGDVTHYLGIGFRLTGPPVAEWNDQIVDGLVVGLFPNKGGKVVIDVRKSMGRGGTLREIADNPVPLKSGVEYAVRVVDDGTSVRVVLDGKEVARGQLADGKDVVSPQVAAGTGLITVFNRPTGRGTMGEAVVRNLRIEAKK